MLYLDLKLAYKQGFRWRPAGFAVPTTTTTLTTPWSTRPVYPVVPSDPYTPSGVGLDDTWSVPDAPQSTPWGVAPVPALPTTAPRPYWRYDRTLDLRKSVDYHLRNRLTVKDSTKSIHSQPSSSRPRSRPRPTPTAPPAAPAAPAPAPVPAVPALVVTPVTPIGVPGSSHDGIDTVSVVINK